MVWRSPASVLPPASGYVLFLLAQKKNQKKGAPSPYRSGSAAFAAMGFNSFEPSPMRLGRLQAVEPIRRSRSSNGTSGASGLRAAEGNIRTSRSYEKYYKISFEGGKCFASRCHGVTECRPPPEKGFEIAFSPAIFPRAAQVRRPGRPLNKGKQLKNFWKSVIFRT